MKKTLVHTILLFFISVNLTAAENDIFFYKINMENGLSQLSVTSIYVDELGSLWFGTREGVNRYNGGNSMMVLQPEPDAKSSLSGSLIKKICGNKNGKVYILTQNGIDEYDLKTSAISHVDTHQMETISYGNEQLWSAEGNKLFYYQDGRKILYTQITQSHSAIKVISLVRDGRIFVGTQSSGVFVVDQHKNIEQGISECSQVSSIFEDSKRNIWIGTWHNGVYTILPNGNIINHTTKFADAKGLSSEFVRDICEDNDGNIWIGTNKGLDKLSPASGEFTHYGSDVFGYQRISNESVWALTKDLQGTIWIGTYFGGVNYFHPATSFYTYHDLQGGAFQNKPFPIISNIIEDKKQNLFLCTEGSGLIYYNPKNKTYRIYPIHSDSKNPSGSNIKTAYYDDDNDELWLGLHLGGINKLDLKTFAITRFDKIKPEWEQSDIVRAILPYKNNFLIATYNGLFVFDRKTFSFSLFSEQLHKTVSYYVDIKIDKNENLWIASRGLYRYNLRTGKCVQYSNIPKDPHSLSNMSVSKILIDSKENVWIATSGSGVNLYNAEKDNFTRFDKTNSALENNYVSNMLESASGSIILSTTQGFSILDTKTYKINNYSIENGLPINSLYNGGLCRLESGEIYLAGMDGMVSFFEEKLSLQQPAFKIRLTNLWINNKRVAPGDATEALNTNLPYVNSIKLNHKQSMVTLEFTSNNYIAANEPIYRYKMDGFSKEWNTLPSGTNKLNFLNLSPGSYKLILEAVSRSNGVAIDRTELEIKITPPFYRSTMAYLLYVLLLAFAIWRYMEFTRSKLLLKTSLEIEKNEKKQIEASNQSKLRFFTNISHEFRTPLTLINSHADMLLQSRNIPPKVYNKILSIKRNTRNMQHLINELLEFRKSEQGFLSIKVYEQDFVVFVKEIYFAFYDFAKHKNIQFDIECPPSEIPVYFDPAQMQKVLYNLISNAFKYTPENRSIKIKIEDAEETISIFIIDSGIGMPEDIIDKIFDRFYQAENGLQINNMSPGTGIGLALSKNIVELHHGEIKVKSEPDAGSVFEVTLSKGKSHFRTEEIVNSENMLDSQTYFTDKPDDEFIQGVIQSQVTGTENNKYSMLIVEDNDELREMLVQIFEPIYHIYTAIDGEDGLNKSIEHQPNIILSDLIMPKMSGIEMCSRIKNNFAVCHIPVILLTAQTAMDYNIEGLRLGADDYITKPFNVKLLIVRCSNLVNGRKILQEKYSRLIDISPNVIATNNIDKEFLEKAYSVIEKHIDKPEFDVGMFSSEMALGRTKLFAKVKGITGETPNEFILKYRLKKATEQLVNHQEHNVSEIAYALGFSTPKYFAKCFKEHFGATPTAYRKDKTGIDTADD